MSRHLTADCACCAASTIKIAMSFVLAGTVLTFCLRGCLCRGKQVPQPEVTAVRLGPGVVSAAGGCSRRQGLTCHDPCHDCGRGPCTHHHACRRDHACTASWQPSGTVTQMGYFGLWPLHAQLAGSTSHKAAVVPLRLAQLNMDTTCWACRIIGLRQWADAAVDQMQQANHAEGCPHAMLQLGAQNGRGTHLSPPPPPPPPWSSLLL